MKFLGLILETPAMNSRKGCGACIFPARCASWWTSLNMSRIVSNSRLLRGWQIWICHWTGCQPNEEMDYLSQEGRQSFANPKIPPKCNWQKKVGGRVANSKLSRVWPWQIFTWGTGVSHPSWHSLSDTVTALCFSETSIFPELLTVCAGKSEFISSENTISKQSHDFPKCLRPYKNNLFKVFRKKSDIFKIVG